jgi:hypothetical protein
MKIVDFFEAHGTAVPNLDVLELIHMIRDAWMKITRDTIFHCWQKVGIVEIQDKIVFKNYTAFCEEIKHATEKTIVQMLNVECNSQQVEDLSRSFLEYDKNAFDPVTGPDTQGPRTTDSSLITKITSDQN